MLEAAHILGTARSFRSGQAKSIITHGETRLVVYGEKAIAEGGQRAIGVQRELPGEITLKVAGAPTRSVAQLADELPLLVLNGDSFDLLTGEPANRRRLLDWGVFHVEHDQREHRARFQRALTQRNQLLRRDRIDPEELEVWTRDLARQGTAVADARQRFFDALIETLKPITEVLAPDIGAIQLSYRRGWDSSLSYLDALQRGMTSDKEQGFTHSGPQRADIRVTVDGHSAAETLSRGQQKLLVAALKLAQGQILAQRQGEVLYLIDDLPSELDQERCERICRMLASMGAQTLITSVEAESVPTHWLGGVDEVQVFHVEQGQISLAAT